MNNFLPKHDAIILANGAFPTKKNILQILKNCNKIICCDGAVNNLYKAGIKPFAIIGDLDSINDNLKILYKSILYKVTEQDTNDLTKAVNWCISHNIKDIIILAATGKREDHTIANIFLLLQYAKKINVALLTNHGVFLPVLQSKKFDSYKGQQISIFSTDANTKITTLNLKYPLKEQALQELWQGSLNECLRDSFTLKFNDGTLIVYLGSTT